MSCKCCDIFASFAPSLVSDETFDSIIEHKCMRTSGIRRGHYVEFWKHRYSAVKNVFNYLQLCPLCTQPCFYGHRYSALLTRIQKYKSRQCQSLLQKLVKRYEEMKKRPYI